MGLSVHSNVLVEAVDPDHIIPCGLKACFPGDRQSCSPFYELGGVYRNGTEAFAETADPPPQSFTTIAEDQRACLTIQILACVLNKGNIKNWWRMQGDAFAL